MVNFSALPSAVVRALVVLILLALGLPAAAQAPTWQSARAVASATSAANGSYSSVAATAVDAAGNVLLAGSFANTVTFGNTTLTSFGGNDAFVAKFNPASNQFVWAQQAGGTGNDVANAVAVSGTSVYIAGSFASPTAGFGSVTLTNSSIIASNNDAFVSKLTDAGITGSFVWSQRAGGTRSEEAFELVVFGTNVYIVGYFNSSTADFAPFTLTNAGTSDAFVAKLTDLGSAGSYVWVQRVGGIYDDFAAGLAVSGSSLYLTVQSRSPVVSFGAISLSTVDNSDAFVAKLSDAGSTSSFVWAQRAGGVYEEAASAVVVSGTSVYIAGWYQSPTLTLGAVTLVNGGPFGSANAFVAKLTDFGSTSSFVWGQQGGGTDADYAFGLAVNGPNLYITGKFHSPRASFGVTSLTNSGPISSSDIFVAKLTDAGSTGSFIWAERAGGMSNDEGVSLITNGTNMYVSGSLASPSANFGTITLNPASYYQLGFLASLTDPTLTATTPALPREPASLFPNPARHTATLRLPANTAPAPLTLTDVLGRPVRRYPAPAGPETTLDLRDLPAGLYLLRGAGPAQRLAVE